MRGKMDREKAARNAAFLMPSDRMGGAERIVQIMTAAAAKSGLYDCVDVFVLCWSRTGTLDSLVSSGNVHLHYTEARSELGGLWKAIRFLTRKPFDLVFSSSTHLNALVSLLRAMRLLRAKRVVARESTVIFDRSLGRGGFVFRALYRFYGAQDMIVCQTERMKESLDRNTNGRFRSLLATIPNPVDLTRAQGCNELVGGSPGELRIVWCGRLSRVKSPEFALRILVELRKIYVGKISMTIVGDGPERGALEGLATTLGIAEEVSFMGHMENPCVAMGGSHVGLVTSETEGFPNVVLEMLASGIPRIVSTDCAGGLRGIPGVVVLDGNDPAKFAQEISRKEQSPSRVEVQEFLLARSPEQFFRKVISG